MNLLPTPTPGVRIDNKITHVNASDARHSHVEVATGVQHEISSI